MAAQASSCRAASYSVEEPGIAWVFRKANNKWVSLFRNEQAPIVESFQLGPAVTHNIKDFEIVTNSSAGGGERVTYKFDGMFYRIVDLAHGRKIQRASATA